MQKSSTNGQHGLLAVRFRLDGARLRHRADGDGKVAQKHDPWAPWRAEQASKPMLAAAGSGQSKRDAGTHVAGRDGAQVMDTESK